MVSKTLKQAGCLSLSMTRLITIPMEDPNAELCQGLIEPLRLSFNIGRSSQRGLEHLEDIQQRQEFKVNHKNFFICAKVLTFLLLSTFSKTFNDNRDQNSVLRSILNNSVNFLKKRVKKRRRLSWVFYLSFLYITLRNEHEKF